MTHLSDKDLSIQESLTKERLKTITGNYILGNDRPKESLIQLIKYVKDSQNLNDDWITFIHNKITMTGSFVNFCEESNIKITPIHTDAISSWRNIYSHEHFIAIGIYKLEKDNVVFYQSGLFHKGTQNEDEVSFFIIANKENQDKYIEIREQYVEWQKKRDRDSLEIEVIGGEPIPYSIDLTWDDLFLDEELKQSIIRMVDSFLKSKDVYSKMKVPWRRGCMFWGPRGNGKTSCLRTIMSVHKDFKPVTINAANGNLNELLEEAFQYAASHAPSLLYFEDFQELVKNIEKSHLLQLLDGIQNKDGILTIATGNDFSNLEDNIINRPRRFDKKFEFSLPNINLSCKYLLKYFKDIINEKKINSIAKQSFDNKFTFAHLQEIYFNSVSIAIVNGRENPIEKDIDLAFKEVIKDKKISDNEFTHRKRDLVDESDNEGNEYE